LQSEPVSPARQHAVASELLARMGQPPPPTLEEIMGRLQELSGRGPTADQIETVARELQGRTHGLLKASIMLALSWGILGMLGTVLDVPVVQTSPQTLKKKLCGRTSASKDQVLGALEKRYGAEMLRPIKSLNAADRFHASDALACIVSALDHDVIRLLRRSVVDNARLATEGDIDFS
jgi:Holliday junction resolvasome RuvABC endonuclease subunit